MPLPAPSDVHVNKPLTNISVAHMQDAMDFVAGMVFPPVPVAKQGDRYFVYDRSDWNRAEMEKRGPSSESAGGGWRLSTDSYFCDVWALHKDIDDQVRANEDAPINMDRDATEYLTQQYLIRREKEFAANFFTTGIWTGSSTGSDITPGTKWDASGGTPIADIQAEMLAVRQKTGRLPNRLVLGADVFTGLANSDDVQDRIKHTQRGVVTTELLASLLEFQPRNDADRMRVFVALGSEETATEGATSSMGNILTAKDALLCYAPSRPSLMRPAAGYIFVWTGLLGAGSTGQRVKRFRMDERSSDRVEIEAAFDAKQVGADLGAYFDAAVS